MLAGQRPEDDHSAASCRHHTNLYARRRTLFSCAHRSAQFTHQPPCLCSRNTGSVSRISQKHCHVFVMSLSGVPFTRFPPVASSPACSLSRPSASSTSLERTRLTPAPLLTGVECLAAWPIRLHTHEQSPTTKTRVEVQEMTNPDQAAKNRKVVSERGVSSLRAEELTFLHLHVAEGSLWRGVH